MSRRILNPIIIYGILSVLAACSNTDMEEMQCSLYNNCPDNQKSTLCSWYGNCGGEDGGGGSPYGKPTSTHHSSGQGTMGDVDHSGDSHY